MSTFQLVVTSIFVALVVVGVGVFALFGGAFGSAGSGPVAIWGTIPQAQMDYILDSLRVSDKSLQDVTYKEIDQASYAQTLLNAMAAGAAPDLFMLTQEELGPFTDKIIPMPYSNISQSAYISSYIDEGQLFLTPYGALAVPFLVDPMVTYWNRDLFASAGVAQPPQYWNDFLALAPKMTSLDSSQNVRRSAVALGQWQNVNHAKAILSTLFMQAGEFVTGRDAQGALVPTFGRSNAEGAAGTAAESALRFYTEFANPGKTTYSWNRSLPRSGEAFVAGQLAVYFGFASEYGAIAEQNPNLRFAVAMMPQLQDGGSQITYGRLTGLAIPRSAPNIAGAAAAALKLTSAAAAAEQIGYNGMPSARRDVPLNTASSAVADVFMRSALVSRGWVDPNTAATDAVFQAMIESVVSGRNEPAGAVSEAMQEFVRLIPQSF